MPPTILNLLFIAAASFVGAAVLTPVIARFAVARGWLDHPDGHRKMHARPVPAVGGIAVFLSFAVALVACAMLREFSGGGARSLTGLYLPLLLGGVVVSGIGLADDMRGVPPLAKLSVQSAAAVFLYFNGIRIESVSNPLDGTLELGFLALPVTVLWLVGMSNAFNLIDGLDGLAAGLGSVSTLGLLAAAWLNGRLEAVVVAAALAGALLGFLPYNFSPARVFLGDCGSLPVGFTLAAIGVQSSIKGPAAVAVAVPLLALALPILDVGLSVMRRFVRRRPVFGADHNHIHHRLIGLGLTQRRAVVTLYGVAVLFAALALAIAMGPKQMGWAAALIVLLLVAAGVRALGYWEVTEFQRSFLSRLAAGVRPAGDAALRGLEEDLAGTSRVEEGWRRLCETAWALGFLELHVVPTADAAGACAEWHAFAPPHVHQERLPLAEEATWSFFVEIGGQVVAEVVARRPLDRIDFEPGRFLAAVEGLLSRGVPWPEAARAKATPAASPDTATPLEVAAPATVAPASADPTAA